MNIYTTCCSLSSCKDFLLVLLLLGGSRSTKSLTNDAKHFQNATVIVKYSWGVFRALSQMIALSYGSMDAPTSENYRFSFSITKKSTGVSNSPLKAINTWHFTLNKVVCRCLSLQIMLKCGSSWSAWCLGVWCTQSSWPTQQPWSLTSTQRPRSTRARSWHFHSSENTAHYRSSYFTQWDRNRSWADVGFTARSVLFLYISILQPIRYCLIIISQRGQCFSVGGGYHII